MLGRTVHTVVLMDLRTETRPQEYQGTRWEMENRCRCMYPKKQMKRKGRCRHVVHVERFVVSVRDLDVVGDA